MKYKVLKLSRLQKQFIAAGADLVFLPLLFWLALVLHFDSLAPTLSPGLRWQVLANIAVTIPIFINVGLYRAVIRYIDQKIITTVLFATTTASIIIATVVRPTLAPTLSYTPFLIYWALTILYVLASRFAARGYFVGRGIAEKGKVHVAIYGAGEAGSRLAAALRLGSNYMPVLFIDDNPNKQRTIIGGLRVYAPACLEKLVPLHDIHTVLLAMPSLGRSQQREIFDRLAPLHLNVKAIPAIEGLLRGAKVEQVRQIDIEDLLGRDTVAPNPDLLGVCIAGKAVFVSGAGGSIGSELCRQIVRLRPKRLVILDISEYALYSIERELRENSDPSIQIIPAIGSVLDQAKCQSLMEAFGIETVYHAAAYKHVPLVEHNPVEGIRNNAFGTMKLAQAAIAAKVSCFVLISTDKAVRPTNVMGASKRLAELILQAFTRQSSSTRFSMVRFGNVLGSSGSVVPLFRKQIQDGGPVTLTHPDITRYFMTIPEAAQLVLQAGAMGEGGDVFVLDMGEPVRIIDLATRMIHLSGQDVRSVKNPNGKIEIQFVGLRPGEKLYEELLIGDNAEGTEHPLIMRANEAAIDWPFLEIMLKQLDEACTRGDQPAIRMHLQKIVKEYNPISELADLVWTKHGASHDRTTSELVSAV